MQASISTTVSRSPRPLASRAIEFWGWRNKDVDGLDRALRANDVRVTAMVIDPMVSMVCEPQQFVAAIRETAAVGGRLRAATIIVAPGARDETASAAEQCDRAVAALRDALPFAEASGMTLAIEPLNTFDHPNVYISRLHHALSIVEAVGSTALGIVVDFYHASRMNELVADTIGDRVGLIRHVQVAGLPHRDEPSAGSAPYLDTVRRVPQRRVRRTHRPRVPPAVGERGKLVLSARVFV